MKQRLVLILLIILSFVMQSTVFQALSLASVSPNILLIITSSLGFMRGEKEGLFVGFLSGLLMDIFFGQLFGFYALLYMFIGYGSGLFHMMFYDEDIKMPMIWIALSELVYGLSVYFFMFLMRSKFEFVYYFNHIILPELIYTVVLTILMYRPIRRYNDWVETLDEESASNYSDLSGAAVSQESNTEEL